jgi:lysozyme
MNISTNGIALIKSFEGLRLKAYKDSAGVWTIGWGSTKYANGNAVKSIDTLVNRECADDLFEVTLKEYVNAVDKAVKVPLNQNQFDALVSITYNVGVGITLNSTLFKKLNAGDYAGAADQFLVWNKITDPKTGAKVPYDVLTKRRAKEQALFLKK